MIPGPVQAAAALAWGDDAHVDHQRDIQKQTHRAYRLIPEVRFSVNIPQGAFYLWAEKVGSTAGT